jgi:hypothetical protein
MKVKKMVKRVLAVGAGATMLGATVMGAMAADLNSYPSMFVEDGTFNGLLVVGENAAAVDNLALTDIASSMKYLKAGASSTTTVEGDAWLVGTSSKKLEMANSNTTSSSVAGETIRSITTFIGDEELGALADGTYATNANSYDYQQFLFFEDTTTTSSLVKYDENDDDVTADFFFVANSQQIGNYKLEFSSTAQSDVTDADGAATTSGDYLDDFRNTDLVLFGKMYSVVEATRPTSGDTTSVKLTLMAGASRDTLLEGESNSYKVGDKEYDVSVTFVDATKAKFTVNGETTSKLGVGETYVLADGSEIGVAEVLYQAYAGGVHSAEFYVGAQKLELRDDNSTVAGGSYNMKVGSEDIDGTTVVITGTDDGTTATLSTIEVNMSAEDDYWLGSGDKMSDVIAAAGEENEVLFGGAFDIDYQGLSGEKTHDLKLKTSSTRRYDLVLFDGDDNEVKIPVVYAEGNTNLSQSENAVTGSRTSQKRLILNETVDIWKNDYTVITGGTAGDGSAKSYLLQYKGSDRQTKTSPKIKFKNMGSSETLEYSVTSQTTTGTVATVKLGGYSFIVQNASVMTADDFQVDMDLNGGGTIAAGAAPGFVDSYGSLWQLKLDNSAGAENFNHTNMTIYQTTPNADDYDNQAPSGVTLLITVTSDPEVRVAQSGLTLVTPTGATEISYGYTSMGTFVTLQSPSGDPQELTMEYPMKQRVPQVYFTSGATSSSTTSGGELTAVTIVDATKLDSEVASVTAQNLIAVGGPCVNTVAAELMGSPADCAEGFTPGKALVKLWEHANGNMAMLVAGYSGADTRLAGKVLAHRWKELSGSEVEIEGTTYTDATLGAPSAMVEAPAKKEAAAE